MTKTLIERLREMSSENKSPRDCIDEAADALEKMDALLRDMQRDAVDYLVPDSKVDMDWFVSRMLGHIDGPAQREAQAYLLPHAEVVLSAAAMAKEKAE